VLDLTQFIAGPAATYVLAALGADVIKVEPLTGDPTRHVGTLFRGGDSAPFLAVNGNKRSIAIDLKSDAGRDIFLRLAARSDVVVENFKPGTMDRLGLGPAVLKATNPGIVHCSITGFGADGPRATSPGLDPIIQALGGIMSLTGAAAAPAMVGVPLTDLAAGLWSVIGILCALRSDADVRQVGTSLLGAATFFVLPRDQQLAASQRRSLGRFGTEHVEFVPYAAFTTADGEIYVAVVRDNEWQRLCRAIGREDLLERADLATNAGRVRQRQDVNNELSATFRKRTCQVWIEALTVADVICGEVRELEDALADPQLMSANPFHDVVHPTAGPLRLMGVPLAFDGAFPDIRRPPPRLGEQSREVIRELLDVSDELVDDLVQAGAISETASRDERAPIGG
jgi:crotonobetainyl-CoA:carnitine CoA-transferase CaiB-like acyl-CoA transferase